MLREVSPKNGFRFGLSMEFADQSAYDGYNEHPTHVAFVQERWLPRSATSSKSTTPSSEPSLPRRRSRSAHLGAIAFARRANGTGKRNLVSPVEAMSALPRPPSQRSSPAASAEAVSTATAEQAVVALCAPGSVVASPSRMTSRSAPPKRRSLPTFPSMRSTPSFP